MLKKLLKLVAPHVAAIAGSAAAIFATDLTRIEDYVLAVAPVVAAAIFTAIRARLHVPTPAPVPAPVAKKSARKAA